MNKGNTTTKEMKIKKGTRVTNLTKVMKVTIVTLVTLVTLVTNMTDPKAMVLQQPGVVPLLYVAISSSVCSGHPAVVHMDSLEVHPAGIRLDSVIYTLQLYIQLYLVI